MKNKLSLNEMLTRIDSKEKKARWFKIALTGLSVIGSTALVVLAVFYATQYVAAHNDLLEKSKETERALVTAEEEREKAKEQAKLAGEQREEAKNQTKKAEEAMKKFESEKQRADDLNLRLHAIEMEKQTKSFEKIVNTSIDLEEVKNKWWKLQFEQQGTRIQTDKRQKKPREH